MDENPLRARAMASLINEGQVQTMYSVKVSGFGSVNDLIDFASAYLVDIGYVSHVGGNFALISADEDCQVASPRDFTWFRDVVMSALSQAGLKAAIVAAAPADPRNEDVKVVEA